MTGNGIQDFAPTVEVGMADSAICDKSGNNLEYVSVVNKESYILLKNISSYKIVEGKLYVKSKEGYAIVDEDNICKIFVDQSILQTTGEYTQDKYGNKIYSNQKVDKESVEYLLSYDDFSAQGKGYFKENVEITRRNNI